MKGEKVEGGQKVRGRGNNDSERGGGGRERDREREGEREGERKGERCESTRIDRGPGEKEAGSLSIIKEPSRCSWLPADPSHNERAARGSSVPPATGRRGTSRGSHKAVTDSQFAIGREDSDFPYVVASGPGGRRGTSMELPLETRLLMLLMRKEKATAPRRASAEETPRSAWLVGSTSP